MWSSFFISVGILLLFTYLPAFLLLRAFNIHTIVALCTAPLVSLCIYSLEAIIYAKLGIRSSWSSIVGPLLIVGTVGMIIWFSKRHAAIKESSCTLRFGIEPNALQLGAFVACGLVAGLLVYVRSLGAADAFICGNDIVHHMSLNLSFFQSGNWSTLETTTTPGMGGAFYPSLWSLLCALAMSSVKANAAISMNACNFFIIAFLYPTSAYLFFAKIFHGNKISIYLASFLSLAAFGFPWEMLLRKTLLYPNMLGFALLGAFLFAFMSCFNRDKHAKRTERTLVVLITLAGLASICLAHPNTLFTAAVFGYCFLVHKIWRHFYEAPLKRRLGAILILSLVVIAVWTGLALTPFMQSVVTNAYTPSGSILGTIVRVAILKSPHLGAQYALAFLVVLGFFSCLIRKGQRWLVLPFLIMSFLYLALLTMPESTLRNILTGFWYNHPTRVFASLSLYALPLATAGAREIVRFAEFIWSRIRKTKQNEPASKEPSLHPVAYCTAAVLIACAVFVLPLPKVFPSAFSFHDLQETLQDFYSPDSDTSFLTSEERDFLQQAAKHVPQGARVLNMPNDGSAFAYALYDMNVGSRDFYNSEEDDCSRAAQIIDTVGTNEESAKLVHDLGFEYVLVLDPENEQAQETIYKNRYDEDQWKHMRALSAETPGLEPVLQEGDMTLYKIDHAKE